MPDAPTFPPPPDVAGTSLSGGEFYVISAEENAALCRSTGVEPDAGGEAHPIYYYIATQVGMGVTVAGLCAACDFDIEEGPMMGSSSVTFEQPLVTDQPYVVTGQIRSLTRKPSRAFGVMDLLDYELRLCLPDGRPVVTSRNSWALPRRELAR
ncbi:MAG: hypothetical protein PSV23_12490 [Brevundimonas sp.]|uniref:hypothetical protein n=1 Tax=Brevundimonas sp. TaxID=1871086 RepID=UPI002488D26C|nr:hypothetical protein [Brevundimonas sp.]MDI1327602.1 hypothetical protein [Brevundimonas sp.]